MALPGLAPSFLLRLTDITGVSFASILFGCALGLFPCCLGHGAPAPSDSWDADGERVCARKWARYGLGSAQSGVGGCKAWV